MYVRMVYGQTPQHIPGCSDVMCPVKEFNAVLQPLLASKACN